MSEEKKKLVPIALQTEYAGNERYMGDESHLIASKTGSCLGAAGDHRLLTMNLDNNSIRLYEAISGNDRYPPGRNMHISLSFEEFEACAEIYKARLTRAEELRAKLNSEGVTVGAGDDFDPFLNDDDLP